MIALVTTVLVASFLGSTHCVGMCGAFAVFAVGSADGPGFRTRVIAAYNLGRLFTYCVFGAAAGAVGAAVDFGGSTVGAQRAAAMLSGAVMVVFGIAAFLRAVGVRLPKVAPPAVLTKVVIAGQKAAFARPPLIRAALIGTLTTLLPCGWLYYFVVTAAGTGHPLSGVFVMVVFWIGTLPAMAAVGAGAAKIAGPFAARMPLFASIAIVAAGLWTLSGRFSAMEAESSDFKSVPAEVTVESFFEQKPACCRDNN